MKILFITNNFPPVIDGVGDYTFHLSDSFVKKGDEVIIVTRMNEQVATNGAKVYAVIESWNFKGINQLIHIVKEEKPDWVSLQYVPYGFSRLGVPFILIYFAVRLRMNNINLMVTFHETYVRYNFKKLAYIIQAIGQRVIAFFLALFSSRVITSIDRYYKQLVRWNARTAIIPVGSNINPQEVKASKLKKDIAPDNEFVIASFGLRNLHILTEAFKKVKGEKKVKLLLCGRVDNKIASALNGQDIIITGEQPSEMIYEYLSIADLFVVADYVSHKGEGGTCSKSGALAAAFAAGLPVIATYGDMTDNLLMQSGAVVFSAYDADKLSSDILSVINDNEKRNRMQKASSDYFRNKLDWKVIAEEYNEK